MIFRFLLLLPVYLIGYFILPWPLVPLAVAYADDNGRLPWVFRWLETHDNLGWLGPLSESATAQYMDNPRKALRRWLWRNKAYTLRYHLGLMPDRSGADWVIAKIRGRAVPRKIGPSFLYIEVIAGGRRYFELQPGFGFYWLRLFMRIGWKLTPMMSGNGKGSAGMYTGITPRIDDWDG